MTTYFALLKSPESAYIVVESDNGIFHASQKAKRRLGNNLNGVMIHQYFDHAKYTQDMTEQVQEPVLNFIPVRDRTLVFTEEES